MTVIIIMLILVMIIMIDILFHKKERFIFESRELSDLIK